MDSIEGAFEAANRQLRETREMFRLPDTAYGLLLLVNEGVWFFNPEAVRFQLCRLWAKRSHGGPRFLHVDWAVFLTAAHVVIDDHGDEKTPVLSLSDPRRERDGLFLSVEDRLLRDWSAFVGLPYEPTTADCLRRSRVSAKAPDPAIRP